MSDLPLLQLHNFTEQELAYIRMMFGQLGRYQIVNGVKEAYYDGKQRARNLNIAIPPTLAGTIETVVGWPGTAVDILDERVTLEGFGWKDPSTELQDKADSWFDENKLSMVTAKAFLDSLIFGVSFMMVGTGFLDEPERLITSESPKHCTGIYDARKDRLVAALCRRWDPQIGQDTAFTLYLPDQNITAVKDMVSMDWVIVNRDEHNLGRCTVARIVNRPRTSNPYGRSEISPALRAYTDNAVRTVLGMEVSREFYSAPQRYVLGADKSAFVGTAWESYIGHYIAVNTERDDQGQFAQQQPTVGQFAAGPMTPFTEQLRTLAQLTSSEAAIPSHLLGFVSDNPPSADAIRAVESRLIRRAERRIEGAGFSIIEVGDLAWRMENRGQPAPKGLYSRWRDPATPTKAAAADGAVKLIGVGVFLPDSEVTWEYLGLDAATRARMKAERAASGGAASDRLLAGLEQAMKQRTLGGPPAVEPGVPGNDPAAQARAIARG